MTDKKRCSWTDERPEFFVHYHDTEWGIPKYDDKELFEILFLQTFQAGLTWEMVLKKREGFRAECDDFDPKKIAKYGETRIKRMLNNPAVIRNREKIKAAIKNARVFLEIQKEYGSFSKYIWGYTDGKILKNKEKVAPVRSDLSDRIADDLKKRGMMYIGTMVIYSYLQSIGILNDHEPDCYLYEKE